jgi:hypothetical protein
MINGCRQANAPACTFSLNTADYQFGAGTHGIDHIRESPEKPSSVFHVGYRAQFMKRGACTECFLTMAPQYDHPDVRVIPCISDGVRKFSEELSRK